MKLLHPRLTNLHPHLLKIFLLDQPPLPLQNNQRHYLPSTKSPTFAISSAKTPIRPFRVLESIGYSEEGSSFALKKV